jgi:hypothetical protein
MKKRRESRKIWLTNKSSITESGHRTCCMCSAVVPTEESKMYKIVFRICQKCFDKVTSKEINK